jgi:hypothetical protein
MSKLTIHFIRVIVYAWVEEPSFDINTIKYGCYMAVGGFAVLKSRCSMLCLHNRLQQAKHFHLQEL